MDEKRTNIKCSEECLSLAFGLTISYIVKKEDGTDVYEFDFLDSRGKSLCNYICKYTNYRYLMKDVIIVKKKCKNDLAILFLGKDHCSDAQNMFGETYKEGWEDGYKEGFEEGFSDNMTWVIFAIENLVKKGKLADKGFLEMVRNEIVGSTWEEREEWLKGADKTILDELMTEEEFKKYSRKKKTKKKKDEDKDKNEKSYPI